MVHLKFLHFLLMVLLSLLVVLHVHRIDKGMNVSLERRVDREVPHRNRANPPSVLVHHRVRLLVWGEMVAGWEGPNKKLRVEGGKVIVARLRVMKHH